MTDLKNLTLEELKRYYLEYRRRTRNKKYDKKYNQKRARTRKVPIDKRELVKDELDIF